jgi:hypothetical protein
MARRLTTTSQADQEIAGSIPAEIKFFLVFFIYLCLWSSEIFWLKAELFTPSNRSTGPMARRLTTTSKADQEIAGSIPA